MGQRIYIQCALLVCLFAVAGCDHDEPKPPKPIVPEVSSTVLVYFIAENNLASGVGYNYLQNNVKDMKTGVKQLPAGATWLVYMDDGIAPTLTQLVKEANGSVSERNIKTYPDQYSTDPKVMKQVLQDAYSLFPADSLGLILSSHASGNLYSANSYTEMNPAPPVKRAFGMEAIDKKPNNNYDENTPSYTMNITDLREGLSGMHRKLQYIFFDACLMGNLESAYELKNAARYLIASPNSTPGVGYPYQLIVSALARMSEYDLTGAVNTYVSTYATNSNTYDDFAASSVIKLDALSGFAAAFNELLGSATVRARLNAVKRSDMQLYEAEEGESATESPYFPLYDVGMLIDSIAPSEKAEALHQLLRRAVVRFVHQDYLTITSRGKYILPYQAGRFCGLSMYLPPVPAEWYLEGYQLLYYPKLAWYQDAGLSRSLRYGIADGF